LDQRSPPRGRRAPVAAERCAAAVHLQVGGGHARRALGHRCDGGQRDPDSRRDHSRRRRRGYRLRHDGGRDVAERRAICPTTCTESARRSRRLSPSDVLTIAARMIAGRGRMSLRIILMSGPAERDLRCDRGQVSEARTGQESLVKNRRFLASHFWISKLCFTIIWLRSFWDG
jgi:hypothetical protein